MDNTFLTNPEIFQINRERAHSDHFFFTEEGHSFGEEMPLRQSLNGTWKFAYAKSPKECNDDFYEPDCDVSGYDDIKVPCHIELAGYGRNQYINMMYPWEGHEDIRPPFIPKDNPVGSYVTFFDLKEELLDKETYISFQGVETAFCLWINGEFVGYSEDSYTPSEWNITKYVKPQGNRLCVRVYKRSSASWLEDQDYFRFFGIFRDVYLYATPKTHVRDIFVHAGLDSDYSDGVFSAELEFLGVMEGTIEYSIKDFDKKTVLSGSDIPVSQSVIIDAGTISGVNKWSAEIPYLYDLEVIIRDNSGKVVESAVLKIGFRTIEMKNGVMLVNGKRIVFHGVNRHEFSAVNGRAITRDEMEQDIKILKCHNINAVRTCHYPDNSYWYELCDRYGIYLIDETNLETHGSVYIDTGVEEYYGVPMNLSEWVPAVVDRATSMLERDKNHASVLLWSCGNESNVGDDIMKMSEFFHERDKSRLVHYEGCVCNNEEYRYVSDVTSRMYWKPADIIQYLESKPDQPYISCEYTHAMGNSCGNMYMYAELEDRFEQYQGGFIWDFADQALLRDGEFMVGGDFKDRPNDGYFCGNGIVFADRKLSPKIMEVKFLYQNIQIFPSGKGILIVNNNLFENTTPYIFEVRLLYNGKTTWAVSFGRDVAPQGKDFVPIDYPEMTEPGEYVIECRAILMAYREWAPVGHIVAYGQSAPIAVEAPKIGSAEEFTDVIMGKSCIGVKTAKVHAIFSKDSGIISYVAKGMELIEKVPRLSFWRAPTDNDIGNGFAADTMMWMGLSRMQKRTDCKVFYRLRNGELLDGTRGVERFIVKKDDPLYGTGLKGAEYAKEIEAVILEYSFVIRGTSECTLTVRYTMTPDGAVRVDAEYPGMQGMPQLGRFGVVLEVPKELSNVEYYGMGPMECYPDRAKGARLGIYKSAVSENVTPYLHPQECGNRTGVRWIKVLDACRHGVVIEAADAPLMASVLPCDEFMLASAHKINYLPPQKNTIISILGAQRGVGGDDSWGAPVYPQFCLDAAEKRTVSFKLSGI